MFKRLLILAVLAMAAIACGPAASSGDPAVEPSVETPSDALPSESMGTESASPSAS
jgi:hypothetical protein